MRKTPCYGKCPYFEVNFYENGFVTYEGLKFVDKIGIYNTQINKKKVAIIKDFIRRSDFFHLMNYMMLKCLIYHLSLLK